MKSLSEEVDVFTAHSMIQNGAIIIDIREFEEAEEISFDIKNRLQIPTNNLLSIIDLLPKELTLIIACHSGKRSLNITRHLLTMNFNTYSLAGGIVEWQKCGLGVNFDNSIEDILALSSLNSINHNIEVKEYTSISS